MTGLIHIPYWWHASLFDLLWLLSGVLALGFSTWNLVDSMRDLGSLDLIRNSPTVHERHYRMVEFVARKNVRDEVIRVSMSVLIIGVGIVAVVVSNPLKGATTLTGFAVTICLVGVAALLATKGGLDTRDRRLLMDLARRRTPRLPGEDA